MKTSYDMKYVTNISLDNGWGDSIVTLLGTTGRIVKRVFPTRVAHKLDNYDIKILVYNGSKWS